MSKNIQIIAIILSICIGCSAEPEINIKASIAKYNLANEINEKIGEEHFFQDRAMKNINPRLGKALIEQLDSQKIYFTANEILYFTNKFQSSADDVEIATMELLDDEVVGIEQLRAVGVRLYGEVNELDDTLGPHDVGSALKHSIHRGMKREMHDEFERIYLHYPGIKRDELSLRSDDGILYVGLNGREREIQTSVPTKASLVSAKLEDDVLRLDIPL